MCVCVRAFVEYLSTKEFMVPQSSHVMVSSLQQIYRGALQLKLLGKNTPMNTIPKTADLLLFKKKKPKCAHRVALVSQTLFKTKHKQGLFYDFGTACMSGRSQPIELETIRNVLQSGVYFGKLRALAKNHTFLRASEYALFNQRDKWSYYY